MSNGISLQSLANGVLLEPGVTGALIALPNRGVHVYQRGTTTQVTVYSDDTLTTPLSQPIQSDVDGNLPGYVAGGQALDAVDTVSGGRVQLNPLDPSSVVTGASVLSLRQFGAQLAGADETSILNTALASFPAQGGKLLIPAGTLKTMSQIVIPPSVTVLCDAGLNWQIGHTDGLNAIVLSASSALMGHGLGSASTQIEVLGTAHIASVIANKDFGSTLQEWAQVSGVHIKGDTGATVTGYGVDFRQLFITSFIKDVTVNCNSVIPTGFRVGGGTSQGFGPVVVDNVWSLNALGDAFLVTEANPSVGSCIAWLNNINLEHWGQSGSGASHGLHVVGFGGLQGITVRNLQTEWNTVMASPSAHVYLDGATGVDIDGFEMFTTNTSNKKGVWITSSAQNQRYRVRRLENVNLLNPAIQDDKTGFTQTGHSIDSYESVFQLTSYGPRTHNGLVTLAGGGSVDRDNGQAGIMVPAGLAPNTLTAVAGRCYLARFVPSRNMSPIKIAVYTITVEGSSGNDPVDVGIYVQNGANLSLVASAGSTTGILNATGPHALGVTASLVAGTPYFVAMAFNGTFAGSAPVLAAVTDQASGQMFGTTFPQLELGFIAQAVPLPSALTIASIVGISTVPKFAVRES